ncbi:RNI-like protein [Dentipellis sp. KUC8613]|nr:RNI-like protein [Dentipellis sp. KUC8613]
MFYKNPSPAQSTTSLSDDDNDDVNRSTFFASPEPATAHWSSPLQILSSAPSTSPTHSPASLLPPELLIHILRHLHNPRDIHSTLLVNRAWCSCSVELLWHKPVLPSTSTLVKMLFVISSDPQEQTFTYAKFIRRLNFLSLNQDITDHFFARLVHCTRLERITLVNCNALTDPVIERTVSAFTNLVAIDLSGVTDVSDRTVNAIAENCRKLQGINLLGCNKVTSASIRALADYCPMLRRVKLSGVSQLTDAPIAAFAKQTPLLLEIDLHNCKHITDRAVRELWVHSHTMREMRLSQCVELTDLAFPAPPQSREPPSSTNNPFPQQTIPDELPPLRLKRPYEHLRMLDLTNCCNITDDAIEGIISVAPRIRNLMLSKCTALTDRSVESICRLGKHLHYLHLGHATEITDVSIKTLARSCQRLRYIDLANCFQLTDMSVFELASLQKLRRIGLVRVSNLTDEAIYALGDRYNTLERVHLSYCDQVSVMAIHFLLQKLQRLNHLSLTGVPAFRRQELQQFCRDPPADFNSSQRQAFCVYSGDGVNQLRKFLMELFNSITEDLNTQAGYEDQGDDEGYGASFDVDDDDYQEVDAMDVDASTEGQSSEVTLVDYHIGPSTAVRAVAAPQRHSEQHHTPVQWSHGVEPSSDDERPNNLPPQATSTRFPTSFWEPRAAPSPPAPHPPHPPPTTIPYSASTPALPPSRPAARWTPLWSRPIFGATQSLTNVAGALEPSQTQTQPQAQATPQHTTGPRPAAQPSSPAASDGSGSGSAAGFFRSFADTGAGARGGGALTPDLVFAEIGHGRGAPGAWVLEPNGRTASQGIVTPPAIAPGQGFVFVDPATLTPDGGNGVGVSGGGGGGRALYGGAGAGAPMVRTTAHGPRGRTGARAARELHDSVHAALGTGTGASTPTSSSSASVSASGSGSGSGSGSTPNGHVNGSANANGNGVAVDGRGRSMKRMLRSSLSTVEQHASSFFGAAGSGSGTRTPQDEDVVVADTLAGRRRRRVHGIDIGT